MEGFLFEEAISFLMQNELNYMVTFDKIMYKGLIFYVILLESAKSRVLRALRAIVPCVPTCPRALRAHVPTCPRVLVPCMPLCPRALRALRALRAHVPSYHTFSWPK